MEPSAPHQFNIFQVFSAYSDIMSKAHLSGAKERLAILSRSLDSSGPTRDMLINQICNLMCCLDLSVGSHQFNLLYEFVFFICRENGQKSISVNRALAGWRLVLNGRFRLLDEWCNFVGMHQRHNILEDTWQQVLAFSRYVNEDLEGYDPKGAWPVLIDEFVEHIYRINKSNDCSSKDYTSADTNEQPCISNTFSGLNLHPGSRRKSKYLEVSEMPDNLARLKRLKQTSFNNNHRHLESDSSVSMIGRTSGNQDGMNKHTTHNCLHTSPCAVEDSLVKGSTRSIPAGCYFHCDPKARVYT
ncbi:defective in cullin neddylation protein AAR3-like [Curcuma longa]|uniref:defective in cullin neddylation protein AAR3-like n=1 Tax=Curcuma longa TaxID=136217 RepID=UPI003D9DE119